MPMYSDGFDDKIWNEDQWEAHLSEVEKKSEQLRKFISSDSKGNTPRWVTLLKENQNEDDAVDAFIEEELLLDEAYFPEEDDDWEDEEEWEDEEFLFGSLDEFDEDEDDFDEGEGWKSLSDDYIQSEYGSIDNLDLYNDARLYAVSLLKWIEAMPPSTRPKLLYDFVGDSLKIGAKLAGGYTFGFDQEYLGGNIAYTKRALMYANRALETLRRLKGAKSVSGEHYSELYSFLHELRNDIGVYIQELRDMFRKGID